MAKWKDEIKEQQVVPQNIKVFAIVVMVYQVLLLVLQQFNVVHFNFNNQQSLIFGVFCVMFDFVAAVLIYRNYFYAGTVILTITTLPVWILGTVALLLFAFSWLANNLLFQAIILLVVGVLAMIFVSWKLIALRILVLYNRRHPPAIIPTEASSNFEPTAIRQVSTTDEQLASKESENPQK